MIFYTHARLKALPLVPVIFPTMRGAAYGNSYSENPIFCLILELLCRGMIHVDHHGVQWSLHIGYTHRTPMFSATHFLMNLLGTTLQQVARVRSFNHATGRRSFQLHSSSRFSTSAPHLAKLSSLPSSCTKLNKYHTSSVMAFLPSADANLSMALMLGPWVPNGNAQFVPGLTHQWEIWRLSRNCLSWINVWRLWRTGVCPDDVPTRWSRVARRWYELPSGNLLHSYWKWPFIVDFPI